MVRTAAERSALVKRQAASEAPEVCWICTTATHHLLASATGRSGTRYHVTHQCVQTVICTSTLVEPTSTYYKCRTERSMNVLVALASPCSSCQDGWPRMRNCVHKSCTCSYIRDAEVGMCCTPSGHPQMSCMLPCVSSLAQCDKQPANCKVVQT